MPAESSLNSVWYRIYTLDSRSILEDKKRGHVLTKYSISFNRQHWERHYSSERLCHLDALSGNRNGFNCIG